MLATILKSPEIQQRMKEPGNRVKRAKGFAR